MVVRAHRLARSDVCIPAPRKPWWRRWFGNRSERAAARYLRRQGFRIVGAQLSPPHGEIDLIALEAGCIVFVEIRSTRLRRPVRAGRVGRSPQADARSPTWPSTSSAAAACSEQPARFDVLVLSWPADRREPRIDHHRHAFEAVGRGRCITDEGTLV